MSSEDNIIIIGGGVSGIAMACQLQRLLNFTNFEIYEKDDEFGGTWYVNTYPGCACDVPSHLYSFSFEKNPDWSQVFPSQPEIQQYMLNVCKKYNLYAHAHLSTECLGANWNHKTERWTADFKNLKNNETYSKSCKFLVTAVGVLSVPNPCPIPKVENFKGEAWHSAKWNHQVDLTNKDVIVIGNGCSAAQFVPVILPQVKTLTQFIRSPHWIVHRPNWYHSERFKWIMRNVPGAMNILRFLFAVLLDSHWTMFRTKAGQWLRNFYAKKSAEYIKATAPEKYHDLLIPKFEIGAKRRIFDASYLRCLNDPKIFLTNDPLVEVKEKSVLTKSGKEYPADAIIYANGFQTHEILMPMIIKGKSGEDIRSRWRRQRGSRAYMGVMVADFPNMFILIGPNTASGHHSIIYMIECNVNYAIRIMKPLLDRQGSIEVTEKAEKRYVDWIESRLEGCIWDKNRESGWYIDKRTGHNDIIYPHFQAHYWFRSLKPVWSDFIVHRVEKSKTFEMKIVLGVMLSAFMIILCLLMGHALIKI